MRQALDQQKETGSSTFDLPAGDDFRVDSDGHLKVMPTERPADNVLFHDNTNTSVEKQMAMMGENGIMHQTMTELLRGRFEGLLKAIRGKA